MTTFGCNELRRWGEFGIILKDRKDKLRQSSELVKAIKEKIRQEAEAIDTDILTGWILS